ncbi:MAG: transglutaminase domain-containing protein [Termitinemataceae bacterium]|nr:MAG: transglutaminase domain-containing protein [Termitinemataceae bacterium]
MRLFVKARFALPEPLVLFFILSMFSCGAGRPRIDEFNPEIGKIGEYLIIKGENFGDIQEESFVSFGSVIPTLTSYKSWSNNEIIVRVPDFGESCPLSVTRAGKRSKALLFSVEDSIPIFQSGQSLLPVIAAVEPAQTQTGRIIEIKGAGFGANQDESSVEFSWAAEHGAQNGGEQHISARADDGVFELWSERLIRLRIPDGAASGFVRVKTSKGRSNPMPVTVLLNAGSKLIKNKKTYAVSYSVDVKANKTTLPNFLFLWVPLPLNCAWQQNKGFIERSAEPFIENYCGVTLYRFLDMQNNFSKKIAVSFLVDVYAVQTEIEFQKIQNLRESAWLKKSLASTKLINAESEFESAKSIVGNETNPYLKALAIYRELFDARQTNALRFCALCRAALVPAQPVAGILVDKNRESRPHIWAAFWLDDFGWVPVDFDTGSFGDLDNNHIAFSFGETELLPMESSSNTSAYEKSYALQNIWEESSSGIKSYSSHWSEITITGVY